jgi:antirestriction protein
MSPKIYIASLSDYNAGVLHGIWIDATQDVDTINEEIQTMLKASPEARPNYCAVCHWHVTEHDKAERISARDHEFTPTTPEEYAIHDYEDFGGIRLSEHESIETVQTIAIELEEHGDAFAAYVDNVGIEYATCDGFTEAYQGEFDSVEDYARDYVEQTGVFPEAVTNYFDYAAFARDCVLGGDIWTAPTANYGVYVFNGNA